MIFGLSLWVCALLFAIAMLGSLVQGLVGLGLGLLAAPVMTLAAPELMPVTPLVLAAVLPFATLVQEARDVDWGGVGWALGGRVPGTILGAALVVAADERLLGVLVGALVLLSVLLTWRTVRVPINRATLVVAGAVSGVTGTATSIGGPPLALLYQHRPPAQIRATLAVLFVAGASGSLVALGVAGEVHRHDLAVAALLLPSLVLGALLARVVRPRVRPELVRAGVLWACAASAVALLVKSLA